MVNCAGPRNATAQHFHQMNGGDLDESESRLAQGPYTGPINVRPRQGTRRRAVQFRLQTLRRERAGSERGPSIQSNTRTQPQSGSQLRTRPRRPLQGLNVEAPSAAQEPAHLTCFIMHRPPGRLSVKCLSLAGLAGHDLHVGLALVIALAAACSHQASSTTSARCGMRFVNGLAPAPVEAPGDAQQGHREDRCADDMLHG